MCWRRARIPMCLEQSEWKVEGVRYVTGSQTTQAWQPLRELWIGKPLGGERVGSEENRDKI